MNALVTGVKRNKTKQNNTEHQQIISIKLAGVEFTENKFPIDRERYG